MNYLRMINWQLLEQEKLKDFYPASFFVAEVLQESGKYVSLEESIKGFNGILNGDYDDLPEQAFYMVGTIEESFSWKKQSL